MNTEPYVSTEAGRCKSYCGIKCISWSSILIGAFVALGLSFLLNLFSTAIGLSIYSVNPEGISTLKIGGILGFAIGIIVVMFFSGWIAGYLGRSHCFKKCCGAIYGLAAWCVALVLMVILASSAAKFVTNYTDYLANKPIVTVMNPNSVANSSANRNATVAVATDKETLGDLSQGAFVLFAMFFLGALASTFGGYVGVASCHKECGPGCTCDKCRSNEQCRPGCQCSKCSK